MKSLKYILAISLLIAPIATQACFHPWNWYNSTSLFRLVEPNKSIEASQRKQSCEGWQALTSEDISLFDIEEIVYSMPLEKYEQFYGAATYNGYNAFARWIKYNDPAIADYLLLAKRNEKIRFQYSSAWYYPTMKVGGPVSLEEIVETSLSNNDPRLRSRYLLQAIRALTTLGEYDKCIEIWQNEASKLGKEDVMYKHIYPYIAGAYHHTGESDKAMNIFASMGDVGSMKYIAQEQNKELNNAEIIALLYNNDVPLVVFEELISRLVISAENFPAVYDIEDKPAVDDELRAIRDVALKAGAHSRHGDNAKWYYIAAYIYAQQGKYDVAKQTLAKSQGYARSKWMDESIEVLNINLDAATSRLDSTYEARLMEQLKWINKKFVEYLTPEISKELTSQYINYYHDKYYWYDILPRIVFITLAPRYIAQGKTTRALQLANYTCYNVFASYDRVEYGYWDWPYDNYISCSGSLDSYRSNTHIENNIDFSNEFFVMIDNMTPDAAMAYAKSIANPKSEFDKFMNANSYTSSDYLNDIIGTLCLRNMRYQEAEEYLAKVSTDYCEMLNTSLHYDPFSYPEKYVGYTPDYRYKFAHKMASLERAMQTTTDNDRYATYALEYGIGIYNSFNRCWSLTHYYQGWVGIKQTPWDNNPEIVARKKQGEEMMLKAIDMFDNDTLASEALYKLQNYYTVATRYPNTPKAEVVKRHCDNLMDYYPQWNPLKYRHE